MTTPPEPTPLTAFRLLRVRALWIGPVVLAAVLVSLIALMYVGAIVRPGDHLRGLPVLLVNEDAPGATGVGDDVRTALLGSRAVAGPLSFHTVSRAEAERRMDDGRAFATVVLPANLTESVDAGDRTAVTVLTNVRKGSIGVELATAVLEPALVRALATIAPEARDDIAVRARPYRPLPDNSAMGLSAFYIALLTTMCGFLGATIVNTSIDSATGSAASEAGTQWSIRAPQPMSRWQTLLAKWCMAAVLVPLLTALVLVVTAGFLGMDAPRYGLLWVVMTYAAIVVAMGTLALLAVFGSLGQLLALMLFVYLAMSASGGTIPREALPWFFRRFSEVDPLRQILDGVRSILYFDARLDAGLRRALVMTTIGLGFWLLVGVLVTRWYDRTGRERLSTDVLARIEAAAADLDIEAPPA